MKPSIQWPISYRPDIDGLRAIAVLSVVAYHVDEALVPGGFTGVDIFFVISGYLITAILRRDLRAGNFSITEFYRRRLLRIGPAYLVVTVLTLLAGSLVMLPDDMRSLASSAGWSALAMPNVYFWLHLDDGYFATASNQIPLLHLWSLGVEEQFYMLWPLTLMLMGKWFGWRNALWLMVALLAAASIVLGQYTAVSAPSFAYYMLPARAGELLIGGLLALRPGFSAGSAKVSAIKSEIVVLCGLALIAWGLFGLDGESIFPGFNALYPTIGAALVVQGGTGNSPRMAAFLRWRPMVFIGLISYSLYLWHWPVLALIRYSTTELGQTTKIVALLGMFVAAYASHRWVEIPFRHGRPSVLVGRHVLASFAAFVLVIGGSAFALARFADIRDAEIVAKHEAALLELRERMQAAFAYPYNCQRSSFHAELVDDPICVVGNPEAIDRGKVPALLIGDSNAAHYIGVLGAIAESKVFAFRNLSVSSCPPVFARGDKYGKPTDRKGCSRYRAGIREQVRRYPYVFLGAQWTTHSRIDGFEADLAATLREMEREGTTIIILGQVPRFPSFNQNCEMARISTPGLECEAANGDGIVPLINRRLKRLAERYPNVWYMDVSEVICPDGRCSPYLSGAPIYYDTGHLSMAGSWDVGRELLFGEIPLPDVFDAMSIDSMDSPRGRASLGDL